MCDVLRSCEVLDDFDDDASARSHRPAPPSRRVAPPSTSRRSAPSRPHGHQILRCDEVLPNYLEEDGVLARTAPLRRAPRFEKKLGTVFSPFSPARRGARVPRRSAGDALLFRRLASEVEIAAFLSRQCDEELPLCTESLMEEFREGPNRPTKNVAKPIPKRKLPPDAGRPRKKTNAAKEKSAGAAKPTTTTASKHRPVKKIPLPPLFVKKMPAKKMPAKNTLGGNAPPNLFRTDSDIGRVLDDPNMTRDLILSLAVAQDTPQPPQRPALRSVLRQNFLWSDYPPLESILRQHLRDYYDLSRSPTPLPDRALLDRVLALIRREVRARGWEFDAPANPDPILRERIRRFYAGRLGGAHRCLDRMRRCPAEKMDRNTLRLHLQMIGGGAGKSPPPYARLPRPLPTPPPKTKEGATFLDPEAQAAAELMMGLVSERPHEKASSQLKQSFAV